MRMVTLLTIIQSLPSPLKISFLFFSPEASQVCSFLPTDHLPAVSARTAAHQLEEEPRELLHQGGRQTCHRQSQLLVADTANLGME